MDMDQQELKNQLTGVLAFPVTPFQADLSLDLEGLRSNGQFLARHNFSALIASGGTGELFSLTPAEHRAVVEFTVAEAGGRMPVIAAVGFNTQLGVEMAREAQSVGA